MAVDARRFLAEVFDRDGRRLGEARLWGSAEWDAEGATWRGWLRVADLEHPELPPGALRLRLPDGREAVCEPLGRRLSRFGEQELAPILGVGEPPWPAEVEPLRYQPVWNETPPRIADDRPALNRLAGVVPATPGQIATEIATAPYLNLMEQGRVERHERDRPDDPTSSFDAAPPLSRADDEPRVIAEADGPSSESW